MDLVKELMETGHSADEIAEAARIKAYCEVRLIELGNGMHLTAENAKRLLIEVLEEYDDRYNAKQEE